MSGCIAPPEPDDRALLAYIEGTADPTTIEHLGRCAHCMARAEALTQSEHMLRDFLYRIDCLSTEQLQDYQFGFLPAAEMEACTAHLQSCPHCMYELTTLERFTTEDFAPTMDIDNTAANTHHAADLLERIRTVVARWLQGGMGQPALALAGVRGGDGDQLLYAAGDQQVGINIQRDLTHPQRHELLGSILGLDFSGDDPDARVWQAHLWQQGTLMAVAAVDDLGSFIFAGLATGEYEINIVGPKVAITIEGLQVS